MKRRYQSMMGVTLLEIMLVLAIAALVIVMSIRFYQSASNASKVNGTVNQIMGIMAAVENYAVGNNGSYAFTSTTLAPYLPGGNSNMTNPFGASVTPTAGSGSTYTIVFGSAVAPTSVCTQVASMLTSASAGRATLATPACTTITVTQGT